MRSFYKKPILCFIFSVAFYSIYAQPAQKEFDAGNITIKDPIVKNFIAGMYKYITSPERGIFNYSDFFIGVYFQNNNDSTYIEASINYYEIFKRRKDSIEYYGYALKGNIFFVFWNDNKFIQKNPDFLNPVIFDNSIPIAYPNGKKIPIPLYHPEKWEIIFCNGKILNLYPPEVAWKYIN
ncbi:MAG: hypothetical protein ABI402_06170 [Ferruginibacter sp.]